MNIKAIEASPATGSAPRIGLRRRLELGRQRRALAGLDAHLLADIGLSREDALRESRRAIWDAPAHWLV